MKKGKKELTRFHIPNRLSILLNTPITTKPTHTTNRRNRLRQPSLLIAIRLVNEPVGIEVALKIVRDEVVVAVVDDRVDEGGELGGVAEGAGADRVEDAGELGIEVEVCAVEVVVAEVVDVFGEVAEEEDVFFAYFAGDCGEES